MDIPPTAPKLGARIRADHAVELHWQRTAETIGLQYELHRGPTPRFDVGESTRIGLTTAGRFVDMSAKVGMQHYAMVVTSGAERSRPTFASVNVPKASPDAATAVGVGER